MFFMRNAISSLALLLISTQASAELEIIELRHRSVDEILPVIRPLLDSDGVASGMNNRLILRTSAHNIGQIRKMLESIDIAPRLLKITVMHDVDNETVARLTEVSGNVGLGREARINLPGSGDNSGLNVESVHGSDRLKARVISTVTTGEERNTQQLQVLEGSRALVRSGRSIPVPQRMVIYNQSGARVIESTQHQEVSSGFYVLPRVSGEQVTLEISAQNDALMPDNQMIRIQRTSSTLSGRLGAWLEVGESGRQTESDDAAVSSRGASRTREKRSMLIRVDEIR